MNAILELTKLYCLGSIRRQVHLTTLFLGGLLLLLPAYVNAFSLGLNAFERVAKDFGLTLITYYGVGMAIFLASTTVGRETESRALYPILARPLSRTQYLVAHYLSVVILLAGSFLFLGVCFSISLSALARTLDLSIFVAIYAAFLQVSIVAACCLMISTLASPALSGTVGLFVFLVGSLPGAFIRFFLVEDRGGGGGSATLATALKAALPNLSLFSLKDPIVHHLSIPGGYLLAITGYAVLWAVVFMLCASIFFGRRDL